jgi:hypothetical protein
MTSPALLDPSLDTPSISAAFTAPAAAEAVTWAAVGITSRFIHADQGVPTRCERGHATIQLAGPNVFGFPGRPSEPPTRRGDTLRGGMAGSLVDPYERLRIADGHHDGNRQGSGPVQVAEHSCGPIWLIKLNAQCLEVRSALPMGARG